MRPLPTALLLRVLLTLVGLAGATLVVVSAWMPVVEVVVLTTSDLAADVDTELSGFDRHGPALIVIALFAALMLVGAALRTARPAMVAAAACGAAVLAIAAISDGPKLDDTGKVGELYEDASASAGTGFYLETLGGALLLVAGGGMLVLSGTGGGRGPRRAPRRPAGRRPGEEAAPAAAPAGRAADDWFDEDPAR